MIYERTQEKFAAFIEIPISTYRSRCSLKFVSKYFRGTVLFSRLITICALSISRQVRFLTPVYHVNVSPTTGNVCLGFLTEENWLPTRCVRDVLSGVFSLLIKPVPENSADQAVLETYNHRKAFYEEKARRSAMNAR